MATEEQIRALAYTIWEQAKSYPHRLFKHVDWCGSGNSGYSFSQW
jgi:hypothetical protein